MKIHFKMLGIGFALLLLAGCAQENQNIIDEAVEAPMYRQLVLNAAMLGHKQGNYFTKNRVFESFDSWECYFRQLESLAPGRCAYEYSDNGSYGLKTVEGALNEYSPIKRQNCIIIVQFYNSSSPKFKAEKVEKIDGKITVTIGHDNPFGFDDDITPWSIAIELPAGYATAESEVQTIFTDTIIRYHP